jgi:hypothetical protein
MKSLLLLLSLSAFATAEVLKLPDYEYELDDINLLNLSSEQVFKKLDRTLVRVHDSICSNRAHMWAWDFALEKFNTGKVFLFFTQSSNSENWWYHVAPIINEAGKVFVLDAGLPERIQTHLSLKNWLQKFQRNKKMCKEIRHSDVALVKEIQRKRTFPETTAAGTYDCYYILTPPGYWTPSQIAVDILNRNEFKSTGPDESEVFQACLEAVTSSLGYAMRRGHGKCTRFLREGSEFNL